MEREFLDENGDKVKMLIEEGNSYEPNLSSGHYKVSDTMRSRAKHRHNNILTSDIGFKSSGFAGVAALSAITVIAGLVVAYIALKY